MKGRVFGILWVVAGAIALQSCSSGSSGPPPGPSPPSSSSVQVAPGVLSLLGLGSANAATVVASENFYSGTLTQTNTCSPSGGAIAAVTPASGNAPVTFTVTPQAVGICALTITDSNGQKATVTVTVTTTTGVIQ